MHIPHSQKFEGIKLCCFDDLLLTLKIKPQVLIAKCYLEIHKLAVHEITSANNYKSAELQKILSMKLSGYMANTNQRHSIIKS